MEPLEQAPQTVSPTAGGNGFAASLVAAVMGAGLLVGSVALMAVNPHGKLTRVIVAAAFVVGGGAVVSGLIPEGGYWAFVACIGMLAIALSKSVKQLD